MANGTLTANGWGNITSGARFFNLEDGSDKTPTVRFTVAMNLRRRDGGEWKDKSLFWDVVAFGGNAKYLYKVAGGDPEALKGAFASFSGEVDFTDKESDDGQSRRYFTVLARDVAVITKGERTGGAAETAGAGSEAEAEPAAAGSPDVF